MRGGLVFKNLGFNELCLERIIKEESILALVPAFFKERAPGVVYTYVNSIRKVLNYGRV